MGRRSRSSAPPATSAASCSGSSLSTPRSPIASPPAGARRGSRSPRCIRRSPRSPTPASPATSRRAARGGTWCSWPSSTANRRSWRPRCSIAGAGPRGGSGRRLPGPGPPALRPLLRRAPGSRARAPLHLRPGRRAGDRRSGARAIAAPGCFATAAQLALYPAGPRRSRRRPGALRGDRLERRRCAARADDAPSGGRTTSSPTRSWGTGTRRRSQRWRAWTGAPTQVPG